MYKYLFLLIFLSVVCKYTEGKHLPKIQALKFEGIQGRIKDNITSTGDNGECSCGGYMCGCCQKVKVKQIHLDNTVCANITYLQKEYGILMTLSIDGKVYISDEVSARNPPPICEGIPDFMKYASVCLRLYDMDYSTSSISGCARFEARWFKASVMKIPLGCFKIPLGEKIVTDIRGRKEKDILYRLENKTDLHAKHGSQRNSEMTKEETLKFIRRLGLLGKTYTDGRLQNIIVGYA